MHIAITVEIAGQDLENLTPQEKSGGAGEKSAGVHAVMDWIEENLPGAEFKLLNSSALLKQVHFEVDTDAIIAANEDSHKERSRPVTLLGFNLLTDDHELINAVCDATSSADRSDRLASGFPYLVRTAREAIRELENQRLAVEELHVYKNRVRAMTGTQYGRKDSGWFEIVHHPS